MSFPGPFFSVGWRGLAGFLIAAFGPDVVFALDAASFTMSAISLGILKLRPRAIAERISFWAELAAGWHDLEIRPWQTVARPLGCRTRPGRSGRLPTA